MSLKQQIAQTERDAQRHIDQLLGQAGRRASQVRRGLGSPWLLGGVATLGFAFALYRFNRPASSQPAEQADVGDGPDKDKTSARRCRPGTLKPAWSAGLLGTLGSQLLLGLASQWLERRSAGERVSPDKGD